MILETRTTTGSFTPFHTPCGLQCLSTTPVDGNYNTTAAGKANSGFAGCTLRVSVSRSVETVAAILQHPQGVR